MAAEPSRTFTVPARSTTHSPINPALDRNIPSSNSNSRTVLESGWQHWPPEPLSPHEQHSLPPAPPSIDSTYRGASDSWISPASRFTPGSSQWESTSNNLQASSPADSPLVDLAGQSFNSPSLLPGHNHDIYRASSRNAQSSQDYMAPLDVRRIGQTTSQSELTVQSETQPPLMPTFPISGMPVSEPQQIAPLTRSPAGVPIPHGYNARLFANVELSNASLQSLHHEVPNLQATPPGTFPPFSLPEPQPHMLSVTQIVGPSIYPPAQTPFSHPELRQVSEPLDLVASRTLPYIPPPQHAFSTPPVPQNHLPQLTHRETSFISHPYNISPQFVTTNILPTPIFPFPVGYPGQVDYLSPLSLAGHAIPFLYPAVNQPPVRKFQALTYRSHILEEFRQNKHGSWEIRDILGHIVEFSSDQYGSRFVQNKLDTIGPEERQVVFNEIFPNHTLKLCVDTYGNYVIQKLFEHGTQRQRDILGCALEGQVALLSFHRHGCRVIQKAVECVDRQGQMKLVYELEPHILGCVKDENGNHVIQKLVEVVPPDFLRFIYQFRGMVFDLARHSHGCRVLQRCFEHLPEDLVRPLLDEVLFHSVALMQDQFGNYLIQHLIQHGGPEDKATLIARLRANFLPLARHKYASHICESAILQSSPEIRKMIIDDMIAEGPDGSSLVGSMMRDQFANYVLQKAMSVVEGEQKEALFSQVRPQVSSMRRRTGPKSKHLHAIERLLER